MTKRSLRSKLRTHGQSVDEVLNTITDLIGLASKGWEVAHGPARSGEMVAQTLAQLVARFCITTQIPSEVVKEMDQMILNAMLLYCDDIERQSGSPKDLLRKELMEAGAAYPKLEMH